MKVKHLIKELQKCDPELEVVTDSEAFHYDTVKVEIESFQDSTYVLITHDKSISGDYDNLNDTPEPLPVTS